MVLTEGEGERQAKTTPTMAGKLGLLLRLQKRTLHLGEEERTAAEEGMSFKSRDEGL